MPFRDCLTYTTNVITGNIRHFGALPSIVFSAGFARLLPQPSLNVRRVVFGVDSGRPPIARLGETPHTKCESSPD